MLNDEAWHWDPEDPVHPHYVTRFLLPFIILPTIVTLYLLPKLNGLLVRAHRRSVSGHLASILKTGSLYSCACC